MILQICQRGVLRAQSQPDAQSAPAAACKSLFVSSGPLRQKPSDRDQAQRDVEFVLDQRGQHLARPQGKSELELQRALLRHRVVNPPELSAIVFWRTSEQRLGFKRPPSTTAILCSPPLHFG